MTRRLYIIAGEPSGDLHGAHLVEALKARQPALEFRGFGGPKMENAGVALDQTIDKLSFMGFTEVVKHLPVILSNFRRAKNAIRDWNPDAIIFIDFPGFNMRMARWTKKQKYTNFYYIAPQAWAWKERRALKLKKNIDELFCILPFEKSFFARFDYDVHYVGHPLVDIIKKYRQNQSDEMGQGASTTNRTDDPSINTSEEQDRISGKIIALLPGSRRQEVTKILPVQLQAIARMPDHQVVIGKSPHVPQTIYDDIVQSSGSVPVSYDEDTYGLLSRAYIACVTSGTATLETALFKVPEVVCFKGSRISYYIARRLIKVPFISLVNLIMKKEVVCELVQHELTADLLRQEVLKLTGDSKRIELKNQYDRLEEALGVGGAADKTAKIMISKLES